jgi:hypothetical protein
VRSYAIMAFLPITYVVGFMTDSSLQPFRTAWLAAGVRELFSDRNVRVRPRIRLRLFHNRRLFLSCGPWDFSYTAHKIHTTPIHFACQEKKFVIELRRLERVKI